MSLVSGYLSPIVLATPLLAGVLASPSPAIASFSVCNKTEHAASVALGYFDGKGWSSAGWWTIGAKLCVRLVEDPLSARYYYLYAEHYDVGGAWEGDRSFCIADKRFNIEGRSDCSGRGYETKKFFQVDTGQSPDWTENLAD